MYLYCSTCTCYKILNFFIFIKKINMYIVLKFLFRLASAFCLLLNTAILLLME